MINADATDVADFPLITFANTAAGGETLHAFADLVVWLVRQNVMTVEGGALLSRAAERERHTAFRAALVFRDVVRRALGHAADHGHLDDALPDAVNELLRHCGCRARVVRDDRGEFRRIVSYVYERPDDVLMPLGNFALDALCRADLSRVKRCKGDGCDVFFIDTSKNRTRAWCSMQRCGNRKKAAAYYQRSKAAKRRRPAF